MHYEVGDISVLMERISNCELAPSYALNVIDIISLQFLGSIQPIAIMPLSTTQVIDNLGVMNMASRLGGVNVVAGHGVSKHDIIQSFYVINIKFGVPRNILALSHVEAINFLRIIADAEWM